MNLKSVKPWSDPRSLITALATLEENSDASGKVKCPEVKKNQPMGWERAGVWNFFQFHFQVDDDVGEIKSAANGRRLWARGNIWALGHIEPDERGASQPLQLQNGGTHFIFSLDLLRIFAPKWGGSATFSTNHVHSPSPCWRDVPHTPQVRVYPAPNGTPRARYIARISERFDFLPRFSISRPKSLVKRQRTKQANGESVNQTSWQGKWAFHGTLTTWIYRLTQSQFTKHAHRSTALEMTVRAVTQTKL